MRAVKRFLDAAFYTRNTPGWERLLRLLLAGGAVTYALAGGAAPRVSALLIGNALLLLATATTGFCPACYLVGRRVLWRREQA